MNATGRWNDLNGIVDGSLLSSQADAESKCQSLQREKKWKLAKVDCFSQLYTKRNIVWTGETIYCNMSLWGKNDQYQKYGNLVPGHLFKKTFTNILNSKTNIKNHPNVGRYLQSVSHQY